VAFLLLYVIRDCRHELASWWQQAHELAVLQLAEVDGAVSRPQEQGVRSTVRGGDRRDKGYFYLFTIF